MNDVREKVVALFEAAEIRPAEADIEAMTDAYPGLLEMAKRLRSVEEAKEETMELTRDCTI